MPCCPGKSDNGNLAPLSLYRREFHSDIIPLVGADLIADRGATHNPTHADGYFYLLSSLTAFLHTFRLGSILKPQIDFSGGWGLARRPVNIGSQGSASSGRILIEQWD